MSRKARLTEKELTLLARAAIECPGETAEVVLARYMELEGRSISLSSVEKHLAQWRKDGTVAPAKAALPREERPLGLEAPWSLGVGAKPEYGITPEATGDLLGVWKYCLVTGHILTLREARWVARLRNIFRSRAPSDTSFGLHTPEPPWPPDDTEESFDSRILGERVQAVDSPSVGALFAYAYEYALRERISQTLNKQMDTRDLDARLATRLSPEWLVYRALDLVPEVATPGSPAEDVGWWESLGPNFVGSSAAGYVLIKCVPKAIIDGQRTAAGVDENFIPVDITYAPYASGLTPEQDRIYAALLLYLAKGPRWNSLSTQELPQILLRLKEWVTRKISLTKRLTEYQKALESADGLKPTDILDPTLLEVVGYQTTTKITTREANNERPHNQAVQE